MIAPLDSSMTRRARAALAAAVVSGLIGCSDRDPMGAADQPQSSQLRITAPPASGDPTRPDVAVTILSEPTERCDVTAIARSTDGAEFRLERATTVLPGVCMARFVDLEVGQRYVFSVRNSIISDPADYQVWPNFRGVPWDDLPLREGAVFVPAAEGAYADGTAERLTAPNLYAAYQRARAVPVPDNASATHRLTIPLQYGDARSVTAAVPDATSPVFVYAIGQLDPAQLPPQAGPSPFPPGVGWYAARTGSPAVLILAREATVVVEGRDEDGIIYSGLLPPNETHIDLFPDPGFFFTYYIVDPYGDNPAGTNDIGLVRYGTERLAGPVQSDEFLIKVDARAVAFAGLPQFDFELADLRDAGGQIVLPSVRVQVLCSGTPEPTCEVAGVIPGSAAAGVLGVTSELDAAGDGWVQLRLDFAGIHAARVRVRGGTGNTASDLAPDVGLTLGPNIENGFGIWQRTDSPGSSWAVPW